MSTYKDLNVYQRAYKVAVDLHHTVEDQPKLAPHLRHQLEASVRSVLANIAESFSQRTARAKRFFNFRARDVIRTIQMDLDFLHDLELLPEKAYQRFYEEYEICSKQLWKLNESFLEKDSKKPQTEKVAVAA